MDTYIQELVKNAQNTPVEELMRQECESRGERVRKAFAAAKQNAEFELLRYYAAFYLEEDLEETNQALLEILTTEEEAVRRRYCLHDKWSLWVNPLLIRFYYNFGSPGRGLLSPELEQAVCETLWERMLYKNDIALAKRSVWHMTGSENHDLNFKICALLTSQMFMELPDYRERTYPDRGTGGGDGYWFHYMYDFMGGEVADRGPEGRADWKEPGREYNAKAHYEAWVEFFKTYFRERAKKGFFLEASASGYMKWTLSFISLLLEFCRDGELKKLCKDFYDLIWCEWAQDQIDGRRGGAKTRCVFEQQQLENDSMYYMAKFLLGGDGIAGHAYYFQMTNGYELPPVVWDMVIHKRELGSYEYFSRRPGEEENVYPRPLGEERTLCCDTQSRMLHYSYVTPDYILGTQMDHPYMPHSHLSCAARWNGLTGGESPDSFLFPAAFRQNEDGTYAPIGSMYRSVQDKNVLICAQHRGYFRIDPEWYPQMEQTASAYGFYFGKKFPEMLEKEDWIFVRDGGMYAALRPAYGGYRKLGDTIILFQEPFAPAIVHAASAADFPNFGAFVEFILKNIRLGLNNIVVPGYFTIRYQTPKTELYFNAANNEPPRINGNLVDYSYPYAFRSPYMEGKYGEGVITVRHGKYSLVLDFQ